MTLSLGDPVAIELDGPIGDLSPFSILDDLADRARFAFLVEMDHFIHEKYAFRLLCMRYLASRGWRWFGEEIDHRVGERSDRYLVTGDETLLEPIDDPPWYTEGILSRTRTEQPMDALTAEQARLARAVRDAVPGARWFGFDVGADDHEYLRMANAAETYEELRPAMAIRERLMHERVEAAVAAAGPDEKVALMAGSLHLMKDDDLVETTVGAGPGGDTGRSVGHHVAQALADGPVLSIWLLHGRGTTASPWVDGGQLEAKRGTVDAKLLRQVDRPCLLRIDDDRGRRQVTQMHNTVVTCRLADQVDALVFAPEVTPIRT